MSIALPAAFAHKLRTCEGYVSKKVDQDGKLVDKMRLTKHANTIFGGKPDYNNFTTTNVVVIQLDGNYFVIDTDDEESDNFITDIMAKYGIVDNVTPSLSNYLLGKKNKNHYYFRLPKDIRWSCKTNYANGNYDVKIRKKHSKLDLLGSENRIMFENKECLDRLKNIPMVTKDLLDDVCAYVPAALLQQSTLCFEPIKKIAPTQVQRVVVKGKHINTESLDQEIKDYIDEMFTIEDSANNESFFYNGAHLLRKYGEGMLGRAAVHYFAQMAGDEIYDYSKVDKWLNGTHVENMSPTYGMLKLKTNGKCVIQLDDDDLSQATTAVNSVVSTDTEEEPAVKEDDMIIKPSEDKNFTTICEKIVPSIRKVLIYCREEWYNYDDQTHLWSAIKEPQKIIKKFLFKCVAANNTDVAIRLSKVPENDLATRNTLIAIQKEYLNMYKKIESLQVLTLVKRDLELSICDNEFCNKLDKTAGKLVFKDGIYDIATDTFSKGLKYEHYLSYTLPYNYKKAKTSDVERVMSEVMKICANEDWRYKYYMEILGYSMLGMPDKEQVAFFMVGETAGNGKSTLLEALTEKMPNYVVKLNSKTFSVGNGDYKKSINSIKGARVAWINEVEKKTQDIETIKDLADGKAIKNPVLFKQKEELIQILAKLFFVSNGEIAFASDEGIKRRYRYVEFVAKFHTQQEHDALEEKREIDFIKDNVFSEFLLTDDGFFALLELILDGSRRWLQTKALKVPEHYAKLAKAACEKNEMYAEFVSNNIVKCAGEFVTKFEIEERYKEKYNGQKMPSEKDIFRKYMASKGFAYDSKKSKRVNGKVKDGCYMGCKLTDLEEEEEE